MTLAGLGKHVVVDLYGCPGALLDDIELMRKLFYQAITAAKMHLRDLSMVKFEPIGLTACAVLSESHLSVHTYPELGYCALDVFTCGEEGDPLEAVKVITERLKPLRQRTTYLVRGDELKETDHDLEYLKILRDFQQGQLKSWS